MNELTITKISNLIRLGLQIDEIAEVLEVSQYAIETFVKGSKNMTYNKFEKNTKLKFKTSIHQNLAQQAAEKGDWRTISNLLEKLEKEDEEKKKKQPRARTRQPIMQKLGDTLIDLNFVFSAKQIEEYDQRKHQLRYGLMLNETFARRGPMYSNLEVWMSSKAERDECLKIIENKLQQSGSEFNT